MAPIPPSIQSAVLAVLREVRDAGIGRVTRTSLFKLVYLLDCAHAETHGGQIASGSGWYFHHYGPFAVDLAGGIDEMATRGLIQAHESTHGDKDFVQYWLGEFPPGPPLADIGIGGSAALRFSTLVRKLAHDLPKLLDHTYFKTLPMQGAIPGRAIDFGALAGVDQVKPHRHTHVKDQARILQLLQLSNKLSKYGAPGGNARALTAHRPIYDQAFADAMAAFDRDDQDSAAIGFTAQLA